MDLDINNYNLDDILTLFKIPVDFNESDLKRAKQKVLKTHPDKSGLPSEYFLFYSKAYKVLYSIFSFKNKTNKESTTEYSSETVESHNQMLDQYFDKNSKMKDPKQFNKWFNKQFEQLQETTQDGYGEWLKTDADMYKTETGTANEQIDRYKQHARTLTTYNGINDMTATFSGTVLGDTAGSNFSSSDLFSRFSYQDIRQAHTETVIPVSDQDYANVKKFKNVDEYSRYRSEQNTTPLSETESAEILNKQNKTDEEMTSHRAYYYAKQQEEVEKKNNVFWGRLYGLTL